MHRIDTSTAQADKFGAGKDGYTNGTPGVTAATECDAAAFDAMQEEILSVVEGMGIVPVKNTNTQLFSGIKAFLAQISVLNWTRRATELKPPGVEEGDYIYGITSGLGLVVAVGVGHGAPGNSNYHTTSLDGVTWVTPAMTAARSLYGVAFNGSNQFVCVGASGGAAPAIYKSADGTTWILSGTIPAVNADMKGVAHNQSNLYVAVGNDDATDAMIFTSPDGEVWTHRVPPVALTLDLKAVAYGGGTWVAVGEKDGTDPYILTSTNGTTWYRRLPTVHRNATLFGVTYGNGIFVAVGEVHAGGYPYILTSADGITWTERTISSAADLNAVGFDGVFMAVGDSNGTTSTIFYSIDGITWTWNPVEVVGDYDLYAVHRGQGRWVASGERVVADMEPYLVSSTVATPEP